MKRGLHSRLAPAAALLLAAASAFPGCREAQAGPGTAPAPPGAAPAPAGPLLLTGELAAVRSADVFVPETPLWALQLRSLAEDGAPVKAGDLLAEFDSSNLASELEQKRILVTETETEVLSLEAELEGAALAKEQAVAARRADLEKALVDAEVPAELRSRREHEEMQLALARARTELAKAEEELAAGRRSAEAQRAVQLIALGRARDERDKLEAAVSALTLRAPKDGVFVVGEHPRERHRKILTGDTVWPGMAIGRIPDLSALRVDALLFDVDDGRVRPGEPALVVPDAFSDRRLPARIASVAPVAQPVGRGSQRMAFRVSVDVTGGDLAGLRPGMSVRVETPPGAGAGPAAEPAAKASPPEPSGARTAKAERRDLVLSVEMKGELAALDAEPIGPVRLPDVWEYRIAFLAPEGSRVKKGQPVLGFDTSTVRQRLEERRNEAESAAKQIERLRRTQALTRADLELQRAQAEARRAKAALKVDVPPEVAGANDLRKARIDLALAETEVSFLDRRLDANARHSRTELSYLEGRRRRAALRASELTSAIARMTVAAPRDGTVLYASNWNGEKKKVGDNCWYGEKVLEVPDLGRIGVQAEVDEADAGVVREGASVTFRLDARPDFELRGTVRSVQRTVQRASALLPLKVAKLAVAVGEVDTGKMKPGMRLRGRVETGRVPAALVVPADAVVPTEAGPYVWVPRGGGSRLVGVKVGRRNEEWVEVRAGLSEGDAVLRGGAPAGKGGAS